MQSYLAKNAAFQSSMHCCQLFNQYENIPSYSRSYMLCCTTSTYLLVNFHDEVFLFLGRSLGGSMMGGVGWSLPPSWLCFVCVVSSGVEGMEESCNGIIRASELVLV